ncbi:hypothetical protein HID58_067983 [Brassica napus]|uniref:Uncharacterized protein n=2 Tax=Brassica napus TaxID=3708 RepID=A0ABQ7ZK13_BRANA|nr:hypothetical protein HID58_067983 [Brassica napus]
MSLYGRDSFINPPRACLNPILGRRGSKPLPLIAAAKKKKSKKDDNHSFSARLDEATGPFPESILLKEKKIDEEIDLLPDIDDAEEMRHYEMVYLIREKHNEEAKSVNEKVQDRSQTPKRIQGNVRWCEKVIRQLMMKCDEAIIKDCPLSLKFHYVWASMNDDDEEGEDEYEVDEDGNVVIVVYENEEGEEDGADELEQGHDQSNNAIRENRTIANVGGG